MWIYEKVEYKIRFSDFVTENNLFALICKKTISNQQTHAKVNLGEGECPQEV